MLLRHGSFGVQVTALEKALAALGFYKGPIDTSFGGGLEAAVVAFQKAHDILTDGVVGPMTADDINDALTAGNYPGLSLDFGTPAPVSAVPPPVPLPKMQVVRCVADIAHGSQGYDHLYLREDAATAFTALRNDVLALGGILTTAGGLRGLSSLAGAARSRTSFHYVGLAYDLALDSGAQRPATDPYIIIPDPDHDRQWLVYARSTLDPAVLAGKCSALGIHGGELTLQGVQVTTVGKDRIHVTSVPVTATVFCLSELAALHGFHKIRSRPVFVNGEDYSGMEFWHHQFSDVLTPLVSTFGATLLQIHTQAEAEAFVYFSAAKNCVYGVDWF